MIYTAFDVKVEVVKTLTELIVRATVTQDSQELARHEISVELEHFLDDDFLESEGTEVCIRAAMIDAVHMATAKFKSKELEPNSERNQENKNEESLKS